MSSKGVSKTLESTFIITTSSRPFSRTLCVGGRVEGGAAAQSPRIPSGGGYPGMQRAIPPAPQSSSAPTHLGETGVDSDEVGHGGAADHRGGRVMRAPPRSPQNPRPLFPGPAPPHPPPLTSSSPAGVAAVWGSARAPSASGTGGRRTRGRTRSAGNRWGSVESGPGTPALKTVSGTAAIPSPFPTHMRHLVTHYQVRGENSDPLGNHVETKKEFGKLQCLEQVQPGLKTS